MGGRGQTALRANPMAAIISARRANTFVAEFNRLAISAICCGPMTRVGLNLISWRRLVPIISRDYPVVSYKFKLINLYV